MEKTVTAALTGFFNVGEGKRPLSAWRDELKQLTDAEKMELATEVGKVEGFTVK